MKKFTFILLLLPALLLWSCNDDDTAPGNEPVSGAWKLIKVSGSIAGVTHNFEEGQVTWTFDDSLQTVKIVNNSTDTAKYSGPASGNYDYENVPNTISPQSCPTTIEIDGNLNMGCKDLNGNSLVFTQLEADGYIFTFKQ